MRGDPKNPEFRAKVIKLRKEGKKWEEVAKAVGVSLSAAKQYHGRKWYMEGMKGKDEPEVKIDGKEKETPGVQTPVKDKGEKHPLDVVTKTKDKAQKQVDKAVGDHINASDKKPLGVVQKKEEDKTSTTDKTVSEPKSKGGGVWFLLAIVLAVVVIAVVFLILRPKPEERAEYNKPVGDEEVPGFEGRTLKDL